MTETITSRVESFLTGDLAIGLGNIRMTLFWIDNDGGGPDPDRRTPRLRRLDEELARLEDRAASLAAELGAAPVAEEDWSREAPDTGSGDAFAETQQAGGLRDEAGSGDPADESAPLDERAAPAPADLPDDADDGTAMVPQCADDGDRDVMPDAPETIMAEDQTDFPDDPEPAFDAAPEVDIDPGCEEPAPEPSSATSAADTAPPPEYVPTGDRARRRSGPRMGLPPLSLISAAGPSDALDLSGYELETGQGAKQNGSGKVIALDAPVTTDRRAAAGAGEDGLGASIDALLDAAVAARSRNESGELKLDLDTLERLLGDVRAAMPGSS